MAKIREITDKFFNRTSSDKTLRDIAADLKAAGAVENGTIKPTASSDFTINGNDVYRFLSDRGTGRIYDGLKSLELISRTIRGASKYSTSLFDNTIIAYSVDDMKAASIATATIIVNSNIGIHEVYLYAKSVGSPEIASYDIFVAKIARQIKAGSFKTEDHIAEALIRVKALVRSALNAKGVR